MDCTDSHAMGSEVEMDNRILISSGGVRHLVRQIVTFRVEKGVIEVHCTNDEAHWAVYKGEEAERIVHEITNWLVSPDIAPVFDIRDAMRRPEQDPIEAARREAGITLEKDR